MSKMEFTASLEGMEDFARDIQKIAKSLPPARVEKHLEEAANIITRDVKSRIKKSVTGNLASAAVTKKLRRFGTSAAPFISTIDRNIAPHAHIIEKGTKKRYHKSGRYVGRVKATPFFRPAVIATGELALLQALRKIQDDVGRSMR